MNVQCWIVQFVADPFRQETKNVGFFADVNGEKIPFFIGQKKIGQDVKHFKMGHIESNGGPSAKAFSCWIKYWHDCLEHDEWDSILETKTNNFKITKNGTLLFPDDSKADEIISYMYEKLVVSSEKKKTKRTVEQTVDKIFKSNDLLKQDLAKGILYPVTKNRKFHVKDIDYSPTYSQENGVLNIYETFNFGAQRNLKAMKFRSQVTSLSLSNLQSKYEKEVTGYVLAKGLDSIENDHKKECYQTLKKKMEFVNLEDESELDDWLAMCTSTAQGEHTGTP